MEHIDRKHNFSASFVLNSKIALGLLVLPLLASLPHHSSAASAKEGEFIIRSPFDGRIDFVAQMGAKAQGGVSDAEIQMDNLREALQLDRRFSKKTDKAIKESIVVRIISDTLEIQREIEKKKLEIAEEKLEALKDEFRFEEEVAVKELQVKENRKTARKHRDLYEDNLLGKPKGTGCKLTHQACIGTTAASELKEAKKISRNLSFEIFEARQKEIIERIPAKISQAEKQVELAQHSLDLVHRNILLGKVACPRECTVSAVYVFKRQFVTKGDPLLSVVFEK